MGDTDFTVYYNTYRLDALDKALRRQGSEVQTAVCATLDSLYEKYVPAQERQDIENRIAQENAQARAEAEATRRFSVVRLKKNGDTYHLADLEHTTLYRLALLYRNKLQHQVGKVPLLHLTGSFQKADRIFGTDYERLAAQIHTSPNVTLTAEFDFDNGVINFQTKDSPGFSSYKLWDISTAAFRATRKQGLKESIREDIFHGALDGKELAPEAASVEDMDTGPAMQM